MEHLIGKGSAMKAFSVDKYEQEGGGACEKDALGLEKSLEL